jgi:hypothetical protein
MIVLEVGDLDPATGDPPVPGGAGMIASNISTIWATYADKALIAPRLQELYTRRRALDMLIGTILRHQVDVTQGDPTLAVRQNQRVVAAQQQRKDVQTEIDKVESLALAARGGAVAPITQQEPVTPQDAVNREYQQNPWFPDAGNQRYSGSPYYPRVRRDW